MGKTRCWYMNTCLIKAWTGICLVWLYQNYSYTHAYLHICNIIMNYPLNRWSSQQVTGLAQALPYYWWNCSWYSLSSSRFTAEYSSQRSQSKQYFARYWYEFENLWLWNCKKFHGKWHHSKHRASRRNIVRQIIYGLTRACTHIYTHTNPF